MTKGHRLGALSSSFFPHQFWEESESKVSARFPLKPLLGLQLMSSHPSHTPVAGLVLGLGSEHTNEGRGQSPAHNYFM